MIFEGVIQRMLLGPFSNLAPIQIILFRHFSDLSLKVLHEGLELQYLRLLQFRINQYNGII